MLLTGCGFHLQGAATPPAEMRQTYVDAVDEHSPFYRKLRIALQDAGVSLVESPGEASAILSIPVDDTGQRVLSVSARNVPTEYEVFYSVQYSIAAGESVLMNTQEVTLTRDYTYDTTLVLGKAREEQMLREALAQDLVRIVLKQVSSLQAAD
jgi:LPS-assembly lipoprotein